MGSGKDDCDLSGDLKAVPILARMADHITSKQRSAVMAAIRSKGNKSTEGVLALAFRREAIKGWRRNQSLPGKPDFTFPKERVAVFVDGCFWHGCRFHCRMPKTRKGYWSPKIERNKRRDVKTNRALRQAGWKVHRIWEHSLRTGDYDFTKLKALLAAGPPKVKQL